MPGGRGSPPVTARIFSSALARAVRCTSPSAARMRSWSMPTSPGSTAEGSIRISWMSPRRLLTARTTPPPAVASTRSAFISSCTRATSACNFCTCFIILPMSRILDLHDLCPEQLHRFGDDRVGLGRHGLSAHVRLVVSVQHRAAQAQVLLQDALDGALDDRPVLGPVQVIEVEVVPAAQPDDQVITLDPERHALDEQGMTEHLRLLHFLQDPRPGAPDIFERHRYGLRSFHHGPHRPPRRRGPRGFW